MRSGLRYLSGIVQLWEILRNALQHATWFAWARTLRCNCTRKAALCPFRLSHQANCSALSQVLRQPDESPIYTQTRSTCDGSCQRYRSVLWRTCDSSTLRLTICLACRRPSGKSSGRRSKSKAVERIWWRCRPYGSVVRAYLSLAAFTERGCIYQGCTRRRWSLNWDQINSQIVVGSCPRSASDIDRIVDEAGISAIICLQVSLAEPSSVTRSSQHVKHSLQLWHAVRSMF